MKPESRTDVRLERLLDEELRAIMQSPPVDLRANVLRAIDEGRGTRNAGRGTRDEERATRDAGRGTRDVGRGTVESGFSRILRPRWALAIACAAVLVLAVFVAWRGSVATREELAAVRPPLRGTPVLAATAIRPAAERPAVEAASSVTINHRRRTAPFTWDPDPVATDASASNEPYLPGAPAGELGDPLRPLPSPPPIAIAPITTTPAVSEFARPVTDFPADNRPPAAGSGEAGPSGGTRR